jgi:hypothetical protein
MFSSFLPPGEEIAERQRWMSLPIALEPLEIAVKRA